VSPRAGPPVTVVNVGYRSTNYWVVSAGTSRLLVDLGYPNTMGLLRANLDRMGVPLREIRYGLATHYHYDHAGLAQELKQAGVPLLVLQNQVDSVPMMMAQVKPSDRFAEISLHDNLTISFGESRKLLEGIGLAGEILPTPGHSDDSVSLLLDDGSVFTGYGIASAALGAPIIRDRITLALGATSLAATAGGLRFGVRASLEFDQAKALCPVRPSCTPADRDRRSALLRDARSDAVVSTVMVAAGGAAAIASVILLVTRPSTRAGATARIVPLTPAGGTGLAFAGQF